MLCGGSASCVGSLQGTTQGRQDHAAQGGGRLSTVVHPGKGKPVCPLEGATPDTPFQSGAGIPCGKHELSGGHHARWIIR